MKRLQRVAACLLAAVSCAAWAGEAKLDGKTAFERLKALDGTWEGTAGHGKSQQPAQVTWRVASGGSVVMETLFPGTPHEMISMYHLVDGQLVMTHYCATGNQPRMRLDLASSTAAELHFAFDGGTNFDPAKDGHIHSGVLKLQGDRLQAEWTFWSGGKLSGTNAFSLARRVPAATPAKN